MNRIGIQKIKAIAADFGIPEWWAVKKAKRHIADMMTETKTALRDHRNTGARNEDERVFILSGIKRLEKEFADLQRYLRYLNNPPAKDSRTVSDDEIEQARNYPVADLLPCEWSGRGNIRCLVHEEKHASMQVNETYLYCHSCHAKLDAIDLVMLRDGVGFIDAVRRLMR